MQIKLLKDVVSAIAGEEATGIVDILYNKKNVNEFNVAKKLGLTINQTRNILYKLADQGLVSFIRKKDSRKGGWYTYFWTFDTGKSLELLRGQIANKINELESELESRKRKRFYYSPGIDAEYSEEEALEYDFVCPETGEIMQLKDNSVIISGIEKEIFELKSALEEIEEAVEVVEKKAERAKSKRLKAEAKAKEIEREKKRRKRARLMKKLVKGRKKAKKKLKKKPKKKIKKKIKKPGKKSKKAKKIKKQKKLRKKIKGKKRK